MITDTNRWIETVVIGHRFCPFANHVYEANGIHYNVVEESQPEAMLHALISECERLDGIQTIETTLMIIPQGVDKFECYLELLELAEQLLIDQGYAGIYQLASFHPCYQFEGVDIDDPSNFTNRSPYPMLHLLREISLERSITDYPDTKAIPERNIKYARALGKEKLADELRRCFTDIQVS